MMKENLKNIHDGEEILLKQGGRYELTEENAFRFEGYYCSNTASKEENPNGERLVGIYLKNKKNVLLDGNGATFTVHGVLTPILLDGCENVTLKNFTIDYARPTMNEFFVASREKDGYILKIPEEMRFRVDGNALIWQGEKKKDGTAYWEIPYRGEEILSMYYDPNTEKTLFFEWQEGDYRPSVPEFEKIMPLDEQTLFVKLKNQSARLPVGCTVQTRDVRRIQIGGFFLRCKNLRLENVSVKAMNGLGLLCQYCDGVTYRNLDCTPKKGRTVASNADFYHFSGCKGKITIDGCRARGAHDDFVNVHGTHLQVEEVDERENVITVAFKHPQSWGFEVFVKGDKIEFIKWDTLLPYASARVLYAERLDDTRIRLKLKGRLPNVEVGKDVVENATWTAALRIKNCVFGPSMGRGILCTTRKTVRIERNVFYKTGGSVLTIEDDCNNWFESGYTKKVIFRKNTVVDGGCGVEENAPTDVITVSPKVYSDAEGIYVHKKIVVEKNKFATTLQTPFSLRVEHVKRFILRKNEFSAEYALESAQVKKLIVKRK